MVAAWWFSWYTEHNLLSEDTCTRRALWPLHSKDDIRYEILWVAEGKRLQSISLCFVQFKAVRRIIGLVHDDTGVARAGVGFRIGRDEIQAGNRRGMRDWSVWYSGNARRNDIVAQLQRIVHRELETASSFTHTAGMALRREGGECCEVRQLLRVLAGFTNLNKWTRRWV